MSADHRDKVAACADRARAEGGTVRCGGRMPASLPDRCAAGYFYEPTVITGLPIDAVTNMEEIFGPVVTITPFEDEDEAVAMANATDYGLSASVWTTDDARMARVSANRGWYGVGQLLVAPRSPGSIRGREAQWRRP